MPIDVELQDRPPRTIGFGLTYETILGFAVNGYWQHRNLFGQAESLRLSAEVNRIGYGTFPTDLGYAFKADFKKPDWWMSGQDGLASLVASRDVFPAYTRKGVNLTMGIDRTLDPHWRVKVGLSGEVSEITRYGITNDYELLGIPMQAILNEADSEVDATRGYRLTLNVTPYADLRNNNDLFAITRLTGTGYLNVSGDGRSVLAGRAVVRHHSGRRQRQHPVRQAVLCRRRRIGARLRLSVAQARAMPSAIRWAAPASSKAASSSVSASASRSVSWPSSMPAPPTSTTCRISRSSLRVSAPASACATTPTSVRPGSISAFRSIRSRSDPAFGLYVSIGQAF